jgi:DNA-directed RNA polymerase subunit RPC12/RpoP
MANKKAPKKTGVNQGIEKGVSEEKFNSKVICKKCGKEIEFTLGSQLFVKCPRCNARVERDLKAENKQAKKIIKWDVLLRSKKTQLSIGFFLTILALVLNMVAYLAEWFTPYWWIRFATIPFVILGYFCIRGTKKNSASGKYKFYAWLALWVNLAVLLAIIILTVPFLYQFLDQILGRG